MQTIDLTGWDKARAHPYDPAKFPQGYDRRPAGAAIRSIVVHSTEGPAGQPFASAAAYLRDSVNVSAHYLVGKAGEIAQILDPSWRAWHAGTVLPQYSSFANTYSIGIENLHAAGEPWPITQLQALEWLVTRLMYDYGLPNIAIETHGQVAAPGPYQRKHDPTDWPRQPAFLAWRAGLIALAPDDDPTWAKWGTRYPLPVEQRGWGIPSLWRDNADTLGEARSIEVWLDTLTAVQSFVGGIVVYEKLPDRASLLRRVRRVE